MRTSWLGLLLLAAACSGESSAHGGAVVTGTTVDALTREPLGGVELTAPGGVSARSDASGRFRLSGLEVGATGPIVAHAAGGLEGEATLRPLASGEIEIVIALRAAEGAVSSGAAVDHDEEADAEHGEEHEESSDDEDDEEDEDDDG